MASAGATSADGPVQGGVSAAAVGSDGGQPGLLLAVLLHRVACLHSGLIHAHRDARRMGCTDDMHAEVHARRCRCRYAGAQSYLTPLNSLRLFNNDFKNGRRHLGLFPRGFHLQPGGPHFRILSVDLAGSQHVILWTSLG